jgi:hypothetical protein
MRDKELIEYEHKLKMEQLKYIRETMKIHHQLDLERLRIKTAEIRKSQLRQEMRR